MINKKIFINHFIFQSDRIENSKYRNI